MHERENQIVSSEIFLKKWYEVAMFFISVSYGEVEKGRGPVLGFLSDFLF